MKKIILTLLFVNLLSTAYCQEEWIVTPKRDTLKGKISVLSGDKNTVDALNLKVGKKKTNYKAYQVLSFQTSKGKIYNSFKIDERYQFVELQQQGKYLSWYKYVDTEVGQRGSYSSNILITNLGEQKTLGNIGFQKGLRKFLTDCKRLTPDIEEGKYTKKNLSQLITEYNTCLAEMESQPTIARALNPTPIAVVTTAPAPSVKNENLEKYDVLVSFIKQTGIGKEGELYNMLDDVRVKIAANQTVPEYLKGAIVEQFSGNELLTQQFNAVVE